MERMSEMPSEFAGLKLNARGDNAGESSNLLIVSAEGESWSVSGSSITGQGGGPVLTDALKSCGIPQLEWLVEFMDQILAANNIVVEG